MTKKKKKKEVITYTVSINGCVITFKDTDTKRYKYIELCLTGIAKLLNLVRDTDDWVAFTELMQSVTEELGAEDIVDRSIPTYVR